MTIPTAPALVTPWHEQAFNVTGIIGKNFANTILNCYLFTSSVVTYTNQRISRFVDFEDVYTSFLFNLLAQSLTIRTYATNLITY